MRVNDKHFLITISCILDYFDASYLCYGITVNFIRACFNYIADNMKIWSIAICHDIWLHTVLIKQLPITLITLVEFPNFSIHLLYCNSIPIRFTYNSFQFPCNTLNNNLIINYDLKHYSLSLFLPKCIFSANLIAVHFNYSFASIQILYYL